MSALRTISLRLRGTSVEILEEMGEETDGVVESTSKLQDKLKALTGVDILTDAGSYKDTYTILKEIGEVWQNLDPMDQAAALELMAGKNRANTLAAILNNMEDLKGAYESALGAEGSALKENAAYLDSIQGRIDLFNNSVQTMWMNFMNSDVLKFIINVGTGLVKLVNHIGLITTAIGGLFTWLSWSSKNSFDLASLLGIHKKDANFFKGFSILGKQGLTGGIAKLFKSLPGVVDSNIKSMQTKRSIANTLTENIIGDSRDVEVTVQDFASAIRSNLESYVDIDTTAIDTQIDSVTNKLAAARKQLDDAKKADFNYYKTLGSKAPAKDRDARIQEASQSVKMLEAQLVDLEQKKNSILDSVSLATAETQKKVGEAQYQSMLSALNEIQGLKLSLGNEQYAAKQIDAISEAAKNGQTSLASYLSTLTDSDAALGNANMALRAYAASVQDGNYSLAGFQQFIQQHNAELQASSIAAKAAVVGHQALNAVLSMGVSLLASFLINGVVKFFDAIHTSSEEAIQAAKEIKDAYQASISDISDNLSTLHGLGDEFTELSKGVDDYGNNISLAADDYDRYKEIVQTILGISPDLVSSYDAEGNAIANKNGLLQQSIELMQEEQRLKAKEFVKDDNLTTLLEGAQEEYADALNIELPTTLSYSGVKIVDGKEKSGFVNQIDDYISKAIGIDYDDSGISNFIANNIELVEAHIGDILNNASQNFTDENGDIWKALTTDQVADLRDYLTSVINGVKKASKEINDSLQIIPQALTSYYGLNDQMKGFLTQYINSFTITSETTEDDILKMKQDIESFTDFLANDTDLQQTISIGYSLQVGKGKNGKTLTAGEYQEQKSELIQNIQDTYDDDKENIILSTLGFDTDPETLDNNIEKAIAHVKNLLTDENDNFVDNMSISDIQFAYKIVADANSMTFEELMIKIQELKKQEGANIIGVKTYSAITADIDAYNESLSQTKEILTNNTEVSQEYKDALIELVGSEEDVNKCFYDANPLIVKNAEGLNDLLKTAKQNITNNLKLAKSQSQLKYYELVNQLGDTINVTKDLSEENSNAANSLLKQIDAVKSSIQQYQLLEDSLLGVTNAYEKFVAAQEVDAQNTYGDSYVEMAQAMYDALYKTGEVGTEQFWAAAEALIPADELAKYEAGAERIQHVFEYFNKNILPTMTLNEDQFSLDFDALENFVEEAQKAGIFTDTGTKEFVFSQEFIDGIADGTNGLKEFATQMGMTEYQAYAMLAELEKYNTDDSELSFIAQLDKTTTGQIMNVTNELERLNKQKLALLEGGYDQNKDEIDAVNESIAAQQALLSGLNADATESVQAYADIGNALIALEGVSTQAGATVKDAMPESVYTKLGLTGNETVQEACDKLQADLLKLEEPTTVTLEIAKKNIEEQIAEIEKSDITIQAEVSLNEDGLYEVKDGSTYGDTKTLETYVGLLNDQTFISSLLESNVSTNDILSNIDANVASIAEKAKEEKSGEDAGEETKKTREESRSEETKIASKNTEERASISASDVAKVVADGTRAGIENGISGAPGYIEPGFSINGTVESAATAIDNLADVIENGAAAIEGATVDLENRPVIDSTTMQKAGWEDFEDGDLATVYSSSYSNEDESKTIVLTPILPDGQVLSPEQLQNYANQLLNGEELDPGINIKLGEFDGEDSIQLANEFAQTLHETQTTLVDPLGINNIEADLISFMNTLDELGVKYDSGIGTWFDGKTDVSIDVPDLVTVLKSKGWTDGAIQSYIQQLSTDLQIEGVNIKLEGIESIEAVTEATGEIPEEESTQYEVTGPGLATAEAINKEIRDIPSTKTSHIDIYETTHRRTVGGGLLGAIGGLFGFGAADGTAHVNGTAYNDGNWGAPKTETALGGELGPEMRVRNGRWELIGQNGAEFFDVKKGDIIFNHKQTEELLKNGYVTGRGKAYAGGTVGGSAYSGLWNPTSPDKSLSNTAGSEIGDAAGKLSAAAQDIDDAAEEFEEVFDWIEVRLEEINEDIGLKSAKLENAIGSSKQNAIIDDMIELNQKLYDNLTAGASRYYQYAEKLLAKIPSQYREAAQDGSIAIEKFAGEAGEETLTAIQDYREWVQKGADATQQAEETLTEIANLAKQAIDNISQEYENKSSMPTIKIEQLEAYNSLIETTIGAESAKVYEEIIKENNKNIDILKEQRNKMQAELNEQVAAGNIEKYSQAWYDAINDIAAVDTEIIELTTDTYNYQDSINELHWDNFDNIISRLEAVSDEADNLIDILSSKDLINKDTAEWTDEGITALGLYAQKMEAAEVQAKKYEEEIDYLNKNWKALGYTEQEYIEKLEELKSGQYDAIKSYNDTKEAIKDLTAERVDAIKKGIEKEIEAYEELISKKKEELDSEKDLYDFQRGVADQQKEIADIERKLAALSADNSASARAQRAKLNAELAKAQQELQDTYYDRSVSDQQEALDKELEAFQKEKDKEMEGWDEYLENTEQVVSDALGTIQSNTGIVYQTLLDMGEEYSLSLADAIVSPWADGEVAIQNYSEKFKLTMSSAVEELQKLATESKNVMSEIESAGQEAITTVSGNVSEYTSGSYASVSDSTAQTSNTNSSSADRTYTVQNGDSLWSIAQNQLGNGSRWQEIYNLNKDQISDPDAISKGQKLKLPKYAKGTTGVHNNQLAWIDELGEELVLRPHNGRLSFMEKGTSVIPADLTENLMEWGELDPSVMLERNRPEIKLHPEVHNTEVNITMDIAEVVHVDRVDNANMPDLTKAVEKQLDKYMKNLNNQIRRYVR